MVEGARRATGTMPPLALKTGKNMSSSNSSEAPNKTPEKKRRYLSAEKKFQIYLEAQDGGKPVGELLRRKVFSRPIWPASGSRSRRGAPRLSAKPGRQQSQVSPEPMRPSNVNSRTRSGLWQICRSNWRSCEKKTNGGSWDR